MSLITCLFTDRYITYVYISVQYIIEIVLGQISRLVNSSRYGSYGVGLNADQAMLGSAVTVSGVPKAFAASSSLPRNTRSSTTARIMRLRSAGYIAGIVGHVLIGMQCQRGDEGFGRPAGQLAPRKHDDDEVAAAGKDDPGIVTQVSLKPGFVGYHRARRQFGLDPVIERLALQ